jgi:enamine deaminase RidA (YjgF/YER057c/UK114 family)
LVNPTNGAFAQAAVVGASAVVFSTTVTSTGNDDGGVRAGFVKLKSAVEAGWSSLDKVFYTYGYPTSPATLQKFRDIRWEFFDKAHAPASTNLLFEGVAAPEGGVGVDVIALPVK